MKSKSFQEILKMIDSACSDVFYSGAKGHEDAVIISAAKIYIAQVSGDGADKPEELES